MADRIPGFLPLLVLGVTLGVSTPSFAQTAPLALPAPGDAASTEAGQAKPKPAKKHVQSKKKPAESADESGLALPGASRSAKKGDPAFSESEAARPKKYVPAEFDRGDGEDPRAAKPFVTPSGRAGMGMRF